MFKEKAQWISASAIKHWHVKTVHCTKRRHYLCSSCRPKESQSIVKVSIRPCVRSGSAGGAAAHVAERLERVLSLGYITVVPQVVQVPTEPVQQPDVSAGTIGNGMYAAHDEPVSFRQTTVIL